MLLLLAAAFAGAPASAQFQAQSDRRFDVDLELVFAVDVSTSVTPPEYRLQMEGIAKAIQHPDVIAAIKTLPPPRIAVSLVQWSGSFNQKVVVGWMLVGDLASATGLSMYPAMAAPDTGTRCPGFAIPCWRKTSPSMGSPS